MMSRWWSLWPLSTTCHHLWDPRWKTPLGLPLLFQLTSVQRSPWAQHQWSTCFSITPCDDADVNLSSHDDESGSFATSGGLSSTSHPIFYYDDDIMEKSPFLTLSIPRYTETMHLNQIHIVVITLTPNNLVRGHPYLRVQEKQFSTTLLVNLVVSTLVSLLFSI